LEDFRLDDDQAFDRCFYNIHGMMYADPSLYSG
jgi:hypothetical protein